MLSFEFTSCTAFRRNGAAVLLAGALAFLTAATPALADPFDDVLAAHPGFSGAVLVEKDGGILFDKAYGLADEARGIANRSATSFHLGTLSMGFTDLAILHLVNTRKFSLDNTAGQFLPGLAAPARDRRIRDLLGGAPADHVLLARLAEAALGKPFADGAGDYVFTSVWQNGMGWDDGALGTDGRYAKGYGADGHRLTPDWPAVLGADGAYATTRDLLRWIDTHYDDALFLTEPSAALPASQQPGFGWNRGQGDFSKAGEGGGFAAAIRVRPDSRLTVIVLSNHAGTPTGAIAEALEQAAMGGPQR
jgi:CubicO group peptidase (beta-lactamase class C family)